MTARFIVGDVLDVLPTLEAGSVDLVMTSPPFLALRSYLPSDHPLKAKEGGSQPTPGAFIDWLVDVVEALDRVLAPHGSLVLELGDTYSGAGGENNLYTSGFSGSQYLDPAKVKQYPGQGIQRSKDGWPADKSLTLIPELFRMTLVYGFNPLTGRQTRRWRLRNVIRWVRPNPPVGALGDKFRPATSELMVFCRTDEAGRRRYFDLDAVREPVQHPLKSATTAFDEQGDRRRKLNPYDSTQSAGAPPLDWWNIPISEDEEPTRYGPKEKPPQPPAGDQKARYPGGNPTYGPGRYGTNVLGSPPLDWWEIPPGGYQGAHYAVFPEALCVRPLKAMCPERVCRTCGEPSRRIVARTGSLNPDRPQAARAMQLAEDAGLTPEHFAAIRSFGISDAGKAMVTQTGAGKNSKRVKVLAAEAKKVLGGYFREFLLEVPATTGFTDCGHDNYRPGMVLDCFGGSGTTAAVAVGHGRDAILIDLDERNFDLAEERIGMFLEGTRG